MENNREYDETIVKYLSNNLNEKEIALVIKWINSNEQNRQHFEELKNTWRLAALKNSLHAIDVESEWRQLQQRIAFDEIKNNTDRENVNLDEKPSSRPTLSQIIILTTIAASVLLIIGLSGGFFNRNNYKEKQVTAFKAAGKDNNVRSRIRRELNTSGRLKKVLLPDGTTATLSNNSEISLYEPFIGNRRNIRLTGKAFFNIAKDKTKPFTVFSGSISTTALGTRFNVTAFPKGKLITVRLYEGSVVIKINYNLQRNIQADFYLRENQELVYNKNLASAKVRRFGENQMMANDGDLLFEDTLSVPSNVKGSWFMFNNQLLENVFDQLENMYHVDIVFSKTDVQNMYFIARFERGYSLDSILNQIALLNHLKIIKKNNKYIVSK